MKRKKCWNIGYCAYMPCFSWPVPMIWPVISSDLDLSIQLPVTAPRIPLQWRYFITKWTTHLFVIFKPWVHSQRFRSDSEVPTPSMHCGLLIHIPHILVLQWCFICSELAGLRLDCSSVPLKSILFHQTSTHGAFILRVLLGVEWLQGGSASILDGDWLLCACSLFYHK